MPTAGLVHGHRAGFEGEVGVLEYVEKDAQEKAPMRQLCRHVLERLTKEDQARALGMLMVHFDFARQPQMLAAICEPWSTDTAVQFCSRLTKTAFVDQTRPNIGV